MTNNSDISNDLLKEKSLWDVYCLSWKLDVPWAILSPPILLGTLLLLFAALTIENHNNLTIQARQVVELGITVSSTILGFLIAGFTVFATLTNPILLVKMARSKKAKGDISWLKNTFAIFMHTFAHYTAFLVIAVLVKLLTFSSGVLPYALSKWASNPILWKSWISAVGLAVFSGWLLYLVLLIGRFVFNTYHACMLSIAVANEDLVTLEPPKGESP